MTTAKQPSYSVGERGRNRVRVFSKRGSLWLDYRSGGKRHRLALGHSDLSKAKRQADKLAADIGSGRHRAPVGTLTLATLFDSYGRAVRKPQKSTRAEKRAADRFLRYFGRNFNPAHFRARHWHDFIRDRREGNAGLRAVGDRTIQAELWFLKHVLNWATVQEREDESPLLERNPLQQMRFRRRGMPRRPRITASEYSAMLIAAPALGWRQHAFLVLAHETGHRAGAIRNLRWNDVDFEHRVIRWRQSSDKIGMEHETPMTDDALHVLRIARENCNGSPFVFPKQRTDGDNDAPTQPRVVQEWFRQLERAAGLARVEGRGWHSFRRKFADDNRDAPPKVLQSLGGWRSYETPVRVYMTGASLEDQRQWMEKRQSSNGHR